MILKKFQLLTPNWGVLPRSLAPLPIFVHAQFWQWLNVGWRLKQWLQCKIRRGRLWAPVRGCTWAPSNVNLENPLLNQKMHKTADQRLHSKLICDWKRFPCVFRTFEVGECPSYKLEMGEQGPLASHYNLTIGFKFTHSDYWLGNAKVQRLVLVQLVLQVCRHSVCRRYRLWRNVSTFNWFQLLLRCTSAHWAISVLEKRQSFVERPQYMQKPAYIRWDRNHILLKSCQESRSIRMRYTKTSVSITYYYSTWTVFVRIGWITCTIDTLDEKCVDVDAP